MQNIKPTFNFITPTQTFNNLTFSELITQMNDYYAQNGDCETSITCNITGEVINTKKSFYSNSNNSYTILELIEITPYIKRISPIKYCPFGINDSITFTLIY